MGSSFIQVQQYGTCLYAALNSLQAADEYEEGEAAANGALSTLREVTDQTAEYAASGLTVARWIDQAREDDALGKGQGWGICLIAPSEQNGGQGLYLLVGWVFD